MSWTPHCSLDDTLTYLKERSDPAKALIVYLITSRASGQVLGSVGGEVVSTRVGFGYCLARDSWGAGYATEAARKFVDAVMLQPEIVRIQAFCDIENHASARVLEKCGLTREGTLRRYMVLPNLGDTPRDVHCYAKVRE